MRYLQILLLQVLVIITNTAVEGTVPRIIPVKTFGKSTFYLGAVRRLRQIDASRFCHNLKMRLVSVESAAKNRKLYNWIRSLNYGNEFWTSGTRLIDGSSWIWQSTGNKFGYTNWASGQPNTKTELCLAFLLDKNNDMVWHDADCNAEYLYICENGDGASSTAAPAQCPSGQQLRLDEKFDGSNLNMANWNREVKFADAPDFEFVIYHDDPKLVQIHGGSLHIFPDFTNTVGLRPNPSGDIHLGSSCNGPVCSRTEQWLKVYGLEPVVSGQITTKNKVSFKYGTIEITAKLPKGDWIYPELYLNPVGEEGDKGQIRIAFLPGNSNLRNTLKGGVLLGPHARTWGEKTLGVSSAWADNFHKFSVKREPNLITFSVDDQVYGTIKPPAQGYSSLASLFKIPQKLPHASSWTTINAPFDKEMYLQIGVGVGGANFNSVQPKPWDIRKRDKFETFMKDSSTWHPTWTSPLIVDEIKICSL